MTSLSLMLASAVLRTVDFGPGTIGGYTCFEVEAKTGEPILTVEYANHPKGLTGKGDFTREDSARYLGKDFDLPVLPGNVNRHEIYRIGRTGRFVGPLIQGQARYARIHVEPADAQVRLTGFTLTNVQVYATEPTVGSFRCSDERLNRLWEAGVQTCRLASFPNHDAWKAVCGKLLPRKLAEGSRDGWSRTTCPVDGTLTVEYEFDANPHFPQGAFEVLAGDRRTKVVQDSTNAIRRVTVRIGKGERFGFGVEKESWPLVESAEIRDTSGRVVWRDDFDAGLDGWEFSRTRAFVADGAKRDRLVWSGDLWWAERNLFHGFAPDVPYMRDSLKMLAFNQTPEGFVKACPYPENAVKPAAGDYGPWPSDEFAAWLVPVAWDYLLYTGDAQTLREIYPAICRLMDYLQASCRADGLFEQRLPTSVSLARSTTGELSHRFYMNLLLWMCYRDAGRIAVELGKPEAAKWRAAADALAATVRKNFWNAEKRWFDFSLEARRFQTFGNGFALACGFATADEARALVPRLVRLGVGKFKAVLIRGKFEYGYGTSALASLEDSNWFKMTEDDWPGAHCTTECMYLMTEGWWDESHPDTALSGQLSDYVLGLRPLEPGYRKWTFAPQPGTLRFAEGRVPTPKGVFEVRWERKGERLACRLKEPGREAREFELPVPAEPKADEVSHAGEDVLEFVDVQTDPRRTEDGELAQTIDLGRVVAVSEITLAAGGRFYGWPGNVRIEGAAEDGKFTELVPRRDLERKPSVTIRLGTVIGSPRVRHVRFTTTRPGEAWLTGFVNMQFSKISFRLEGE